MPDVLKRYFASKDWRDSWKTGLALVAVTYLVRDGASFFLQIELSSTTTSIIAAAIVFGSRFALRRALSNLPPEAIPDHDNEAPNEAEGSR